jgi:hypothetical protein
VIPSLTDMLPSLAVPVLSGGWYGPTDVVFLQVPGIAAHLRRSPESIAQLVDHATVAMTWRAQWQADGGELLLDWGASYRAWRLR